MLLFVLALSWASVVVGLAARTVEGASAFAFVVLFLPYVSSAFVPVHSMPAWLTAVAEHQPMTPMIETIRGLLMGMPVGDSVWPAVLWFGALAAVSLGAAIHLFRRAGR